MITVLAPLLTVDSVDCRRPRGREEGLLYKDTETIKRYVIIPGLLLLVGLSILWHALLNPQASGTTDAGVRLVVKCSTYRIE